MVPSLLMRWMPFWCKSRYGGLVTAVEAKELDGTVSILAITEARFARVAFVENSGHHVTRAPFMSRKDIEWSFSLLGSCFHMCVLAGTPLWVVMGCPWEHS